MEHNRTLFIGGIALIILILGGAIGYMATHPAPEPSVLPPVSGPILLENKAIQEEGQYYELEANYPANTPLRDSAGAGADAHAVEVLKQFSENVLENFKEQNNLAAITPEEVEMFGLGDGRKYALAADYQLYTSPSTVSYVYLIYEDTLGAHPNAYYRTFTFDAATGEGLTLANLFAPGADYLSLLSQISRERLTVQIAEASNIPEAELDRSMLDAGTTPDEDNFLTFYIDESDLVLIFPPYQVGPWALGVQEVRIPKTEISSILKVEYR